MMCLNKMIKVYVRNKFNEKNLVFFWFNEKYMVDCMWGCLYRKLGVFNFERSFLSLKYYNIKDLKLFLF